MEITMNKKLTNEEIKILFVSIMRFQLEKIGCFKELNNSLEFLEKYGIPFEYGEDNRFWCSAFPYLNGDYYYLTFISNNVFDYIKVTPDSPFTIETI